MIPRALVEVAPDLDAFWAGVQTGAVVIGVIVSLLVVIGFARRMIGA